MNHANTIRPTPEETARNVQTWNLTQGGKLILCNGYKGQSKLFIQKLHGRAPHNKRRGLWDVFTTTRNPIRQSGIYVCRIIRFQIDQKGNPHLLVEPLSWLGTDINANSPAWKFVFDSNDFASDFTFTSFPKFEVWNTAAAYEVLDEMVKDYDEEDLPQAPVNENDLVWEKLAVHCLLQKGMELINTLGEALDSLPPEEDLSISLLRNPVLYQVSYPRTVRVFNKWRMERQQKMGTIHVDEACRFIKHLLREFNKYGLESEDDSVISCVEEVLWHYEKCGIKPDWSAIYEDGKDADYDEGSNGGQGLQNALYGSDGDDSGDNYDDNWDEECGSADKDS